MYAPTQEKAINELKESEAAQRLDKKAKQMYSLQQALHKVQNENRSLREKAKEVHTYIHTYMCNTFAPYINQCCIDLY